MSRIEMQQMGLIDELTYDVLIIDSNLLH